MKIKVDLVAKLPESVKINEEDNVTGEIMSKWIEIQCDYMPKYCRECCLQGHDEENYWNVNPKLLDKEKEQSKNETVVENARETRGNEQKIVMQGWKRTGTNKHKQEWMTRRRNQYIKDQYGHIQEEIKYTNNNPFKAL